MGLRDMIFGRFIKVNADDVYTPDEQARDIQTRQEELERQLRERKRRRDIVYSQVQGLRGR